MELSTPPSEIFAYDLLSGHVAIAIGGGTNLGKAATEFARGGADVVIAVRRHPVARGRRGADRPRCT